MDNGALLHETTKRLTGEVATLKQQLQEQNEQVHYDDHASS